MGTARAVSVLAVAGLLSTALISHADARRLPESPVGGAPLSADLDGQQEVDRGRRRDRCNSAPTTK